MTERLRLRAHRLRVARGIGRPLAGQRTLEDPLRRPRVHGVRRHLDLEHPVRDVFGDAALRQPRASRRTFERLELAPPLEHRHDARLGIELRLDLVVLVFARDLADNKARNAANKVTGVKLLQGDLAEAWREGDSDYATVALRFALVDKTLDRNSGQVIAGIEEYARQKDYFFITGIHHHDPELFEKYSQLLLERGAEGVITIDLNLQYSIPLPML